ncbi:MAG: HEPN domain-containing protein [Nitrospirae bacterium]|nr:HEPN domain-containing protein [Nitrospirota bacterium]
MADSKVVREWLTKADDDFNFARINLEEDNKFYSQICFHFQQSAEKYLKAYISAYDLEFEKIHNLVALLKICGKRDVSLLSLMEQCELLNTAYIDTRYPVHWPTDYSKEKAQKMRDAAGKIAQTVKEILEKGGIKL